MIAYNFKCRQRSCQIFVEKKGDRCDEHLLKSFDRGHVYTDENGDSYIREDKVVEIIRIFDRKLRKK